MRKRTAVWCGGLAAASLLMGASAAWAHDVVRSSDGTIDNAEATHHHHTHQHGGEDGHLGASNSGNIAVISKLALKNVEPGKIADVGVHKGFAYLAAWGGETCRYNGVHVVDIRNPAKPKEVAFIQAKEGSAPGEGVQAVSIDTPKFKGDILVTNNETCNEKTGFGGLNIYNVSNPGKPAMLTEGFGDETVPGQGKKAANEIHSVFAWDAGDKAYAVIVDNDEAADVDIVDITDPRKPFLVREYDLVDMIPGLTTGEPSNLTQIFHHDMIVKQIGGRQIMLVSYWDGGYVKLDVTDPANAFYIADSDFGAVDTELLEQTGATEKPEGNAHQAEFTLDNNYIIAADEDFSPFGARTTTNDVGDGELFAIPGDATPRLDAGDSLTGQTVYFGRGCPGDAVPAAGNGTQIAVVVRGVCSFTEKIAAVEAVGGYAAAVVVNREGADACGALAMAVSGEIPAYSVPREDGYKLFDIGGFDEGACLAGTAQDLPGRNLGDTGDTVTFTSFFDGWGYVRLFANSPGGKLVQLDTYAIPEAMDESLASTMGDLSVHEVATSSVYPERAYFSYYSGGFRVTEIQNDELVEVGHFIDEGGNNFWGVQTFIHDGQEYVAASDRDFGLYIFKYNP